MAEPAKQDNIITKKSKTLIDWIVIGLGIFLVALIFMVAAIATPKQKMNALLLAGTILTIYIVWQKKDKPPSLEQIAKRISNKVGHSEYDDFKNINPSNLFGFAIENFYWVEFFSDAKVVKYDWKNNNVLEIRRGKIDDILKELREDEFQKTLMLEDYRKAKRQEKLEEQGLEINE